MNDKHEESIRRYEEWAVRWEELLSKSGNLIEEIKAYCRENSDLTMLYILAATCTDELNVMARDKMDWAEKIAPQRVLWPINKKMGGSDKDQIKDFFEAINLGHDPHTVIDVAAFYTGKQTTARRWAVKLSKVIHEEKENLSRFALLGEVSSDLFEQKKEDVIKILQSENPQFSPECLEYKRLLLKECSNLGSLNKSTHSKWRQAMKYQLYVATNCRPDLVSELYEIGASYGPHAGAREGSGTWGANVRQRIEERIFESLKSLVKPAS